MTSGGVPEGVIQEVHDAVSVWLEDTDVDQFSNEVARAASLVPSVVDVFARDAAVQKLRERADRLLSEPEARWLVAELDAIYDSSSPREISDLTKEEIKQLAEDVIFECRPFFDPAYQYGPDEDVEKAIERFFTRRKST